MYLLMSFETKITATMSELNREPSRIARAAAKGPVIITERGKPARVLMTFEEFERLKHGEAAEAPAPRPMSLYDAFKVLPDISDIEWEVPEMKGDWSMKVPDPE